VLGLLFTEGIIYYRLLLLGFFVKVFYSSFWRIGLLLAWLNSITGKVEFELLRDKVS
jgi:hypothetical protein